MQRSSLRLIASDSLLGFIAECNHPVTLHRFIIEIRSWNNFTLDNTPMAYNTIRKGHFTEFEDLCRCFPHMYGRQCMPLSLKLLAWSHGLCSQNIGRVDYARA